MPRKFQILMLSFAVSAFAAIAAGANGLPQAGKEIKKGVDATEDTTTQAAKTTAHAVKKETKKVGDKSQRAADATGHEVKKTTVKVGTAAKRDTKVAVSKTEEGGSAAEHATTHVVKKGAKATEHGAKKTAETVKEPFK